MALQRQELVVPLGVTMNEGVPRELLPTTQLRDIQNGRVRKPGQIEKRYGYDLLADGVGTKVGVGTLTSPAQRLLRREDEVLVIDGGNSLASYSPNKNAWKSRALAPEVQITNRSTVGQTYFLGGITNTCTARIGNYVAVGWDDQLAGFQAAVRVYDDTSGALLAELYLPALNAFRVRVIAVGNFFVATVTIGSGTPFGINAYTLDTNSSTFIWSVAASLTTLATTDSSSVYDVFALDATNFVLLNDASTGGTLDLYRFGVSPVALADSELDIRAGKTITNSCALYVSGVIYCVFWNDTDSTVEVKGHSTSTLAQTFAAQVVATLSGADPNVVTVGEKNDSASQVWVAWEIRPSSNADMMGFGWRQVTSAGSVHATTHAQYALQMFSRPFEYDGRSYICATTGFGYPSGASRQLDQAAILVVDLGSDQVSTAEYRVRPIARFAEGEINSDITILSSVSVAADGIAHLAFNVLDPNFAWSIGVAGVATSVDMVRLKFPALAQTDTHWAGWSEVGTNTMVPSGLLHNYDGDLLREFWSYYPWIDQITVESGGSLTLGTQYDYCVVYVALDNQGRIWRSRPSIIRSQTPAGANLTIRLRIAYYTATSQEQDAGVDVVGIEIYRRAAASDPFVRLANGGSTSWPNSRAGTGFLQVDDEGSFSTTGQPNLYTTGGVLEAFTPPPSTQSVVFDNRLWVFDRNVLWYTREILEDEGPAFHPAQTIVVGDEADITALAVMDSSLVIFKAESLFFLQGVGPDDTGANPSYSVPQRVMSAVGCTNLRSVVVGGKGVYFQSRRGIERLNRDFSQEYIGQRVEDSFSGNYDVSAAVHVQRDAELRFSVIADDPELSSLTYDELNDVWSRDIFRSILVPIRTPVSAVSVAGSYYWLEASSVRVYKETVDSYSDRYWTGDSISHSWITLLIETGDIALGNPVTEIEWWRTMLFARRAGNHELSVEIALSQADSYGTPKFWSVADIATWMGIPIEIPEMLPAGQRGRSVRFRINDLTDFGGAPTKGPILYAIGLEYGVEGGLARVPVGQRK